MCRTLQLSTSVGSHRTKLPLPLDLPRFYTVIDVRLRCRHCEGFSPRFSAPATATSRPRASTPTTIISRPKISSLATKSYSPRSSRPSASLDARQYHRTPRRLLGSVFRILLLSLSGWTPTYCPLVERRDVLSNRGYLALRFLLFGVPSTILFLTI